MEVTRNKKVRVTANPVIGANSYLETEYRIEIDVNGTGIVAIPLPNARFVDNPFIEPRPQVSAETLARIISEALK